MFIERRNRMLKRLGLLLAISLFALASTGLADGITKRVRFAKDRSSVTLSNSVIRGERDTYILGAKTGQRMTVRITSVEDNAVFQIESPDGTYLDNAGETDDATSFSAALPENGDYRIVVGGTRGNASYRLTVSIK
jgi:type II secretory pathway pseudopilin PulG